MPYAPYAHQIEAFNRSREMPAFAYLMGMRCVDADTEYLSPEGWRRIGSYSNGQVAEFRLDGTAHFVDPIEYIKSPVDRFWHLKSQGGVDQVLSENHRILACGRPNAKWGRKVGEVPDRSRPFAPVVGTSAWRETSPLEMSQIRKSIKKNNTQSFAGHLPTSFLMRVDSQIDLTDDQIRLMVAFHADGTLSPRPAKDSTPWRGRVRVKRDRKKARMRLLLQRAAIAWEESTAADDYSIFSFVPPQHTKQFGPDWWRASDGQRRVIVDEVLRWDGGPRKSGWYYASRHESDVDFVQYCFAGQAFRTSISFSPEQEGKCSAIYQVYITGNGRSSNLAMMPRPVPYERQHDGFMYSFSVPSTYLVLRRNGKVFVTGNTGKTKVTIDDWMDKVANRHVDDLVVVAPAGTYRVWETELQKHVLDGFEYNLGIWDSSAGVRHKRALWTMARSRGRPRVLLVNIEALSAADTNEVKELLFEIMKVSRQRTFMAVDESTGIKNPTSGRTFTCAALGQLASIRRILTGLPTPRSPLDAYGQFAFLDPRILGFVGAGSGHERFVNGYNKFYAHHAVIRNIKVGARYQRIVVGYEHEDEIRDKIIPYSYRRTLRECSDVPNHLYVTREVELTPQQRKAYAEMKAYFLTELEGGETITAQQVVTMQLKLHQICCGHVTDQFDVRHPVKTNRPQALYELLREYDGKAVIWCSYDWDVRLVTDFLRGKFGEASVAQFWGGNRSTREEDNRRFKEDPQCLYLIATPSAGGRGRNWSEADLMVYYSNTDNLEHRDQSEERGSDMGKLDRVTVVDFITRGTVEEKIVKNLRGKIDMAASITGDDWREWVV